MSGGLRKRDEPVMKTGILARYWHVLKGRVSNPYPEMKEGGRSDERDIKGTGVKEKLQEFQA